MNPCHGPVSQTGKRCHFLNGSRGHFWRPLSFFDRKHGVSVIALSLAYRFDFLLWGRSQPTSCRLVLWVRLSPSTLAKTRFCPHLDTILVFIPLIAAKAVAVAYGGEAVS